MPGQADEYSKALDQIKSTTNTVITDLNAQLEQIKQSNHQVLDVMSKTMSNASGTQTAEYNKALEQIKSSNESMVAEFRTQLQQLKNYNINLLTNVSKDIESSAKTQVDEYAKKLEADTVSAEQQIGQKANQNYQQVQKDIAAYKQAQIKKIDESLQGMVKKLASEILEKSITPSEHKDLIMQTLEKAKNDNVFLN